MTFVRFLLAAVCLLTPGMVRSANFPSGEDNFLNAVLISTNNGLSASFLPDTFSAEAGEPQISGKAPQRSAWWRWIAPADGILTLEMVAPRINTPTAVDTLLGVYQGVAVNALTLVAQNDDYPPGYLSRVTFLVTAGQEYRIKCDHVPNTDVGGMCLSLRFFQPAARTYAGAVTMGFGPGQQAFVTLSTTASGSYSGKLTIPGKTFPFTGHAGARAAILLGVPTALLSPGVSLEIDLANGTESLPCILTNGTAVEASLLYPAASFTKASPASVAGYYTARIATNVANGFLTGKISTTGKFSFVGKAGDGAAVIFAGGLGKVSAGIFAVPFLAKTLGGKGYLIGEFRVVEGSTDTISSTGLEVRYYRPPGSGTFFPLGIQNSTSITGAVFTKPAAGQRALSFLDPTAGAGVLKITSVAGEISSLSENLTLTPNNVFTFAVATRHPKLTLNTTTGLVTGSIVDADGITRKLSGVLTASPTPTIVGFGTGFTATVPFTVTN